MLAMASSGRISWYTWDQRYDFLLKFYLIEKANEWQIAMGQYQHLAYRAITMVRGGLISMLTRKTTDLSVRDVDPAASLTLMSADIERIVQGWQTMHEMWANIIEIAVAIVLLEAQLGISCLIPVAVAVGTFFFLFHSYE